MTVTPTGNGNLTSALAGWWLWLWAGSGCGGSGRAPGWCGWAVASLLQRCCGGAVKDLLHSDSEDACQWLTTSQMGWALTRERNELTNERDKQEGKLVVRQLAT